MVLVRTRDRSEAATVLRDCARLAAVLAGLVCVWYALTWHHGLGLPRDGSTLAVGRDFVNFWMYGRAALASDPGRWYDPSAYQDALGRWLGPDYPGQNWSYPPTVMLLAAPFGRLSYLPALGLWTVLGLGLFGRAAWRRTGSAQAMLALLICPAALFCLVSGQSSFITTAVLIGVFALLDRRPAMAGLLIGCLSLKPHLGLMFPVMLAASGRWRTFSAAAATASGLAAIATILFGPDVWVSFVTEGLPTQNRVLADPDGIATPFFATVFMNLRGVGVPYPVAMSVQVAFALAGAAAVAWAFRSRREADPAVLSALFLAASVAATPYLLVYDTLPLAVAALTLLTRGGVNATGRLFAKLVFWLPLVQMTCGFVHLPGPGLIAPAFAAYLVARLRPAIVVPASGLPATA